MMIALAAAEDNSDREEMISEEEIAPQAELEWLEEMKAKEEDNLL